MAFLVEDGTGLALANSYISIAEADTHHGDRNQTAWTGTDPVKQAALIKATDYVDKRFGKRFRGFRESKTQGLEWPRIDAFDNDDFLYSDVDRIPRNLKKAIAEYALLALQLVDLLPTPARPFPILNPATGTVTSGGSSQVISKKEKVDVIEEETRFSDTSNLLLKLKPGASLSSIVAAGSLPEYPVADEWIQELLRSSISLDLGRA